MYGAKYAITLAQDINLRIKWPNDVYFGEGLKLGGVLVRSTILQDTLHINLGWWPLILKSMKKRAWMVEVNKWDE